MQGWIQRNQKWGGKPFMNLWTFMLAKIVGRSI